MGVVKESGGVLVGQSVPSALGLTSAAPEIGVQTMAWGRGLEKSNGGLAVSGWHL